MGIRIHPLNLSESDYAGECFIESGLALDFMKFRMLFMIMLFVLAPMSGCLSSAEEDSTKADSIVNGSNSLIKMTDESFGENCAYGGVKIESGIDLDGNQKGFSVPGGNSIIDDTLFFDFSDSKETTVFDELSMIKPGQAVQWSAISFRDQKYENLTINQIAR